MKASPTANNNAQNEIRTATRAPTHAGKRHETKEGGEGQGRAGHRADERQTDRQTHLRDDGDSLAQVLQADLERVYTVDCDAAAARLHHAEERHHEGRLARPRPPGDAYPLAALRSD